LLGKEQHSNSFHSINRYKVRRYMMKIHSINRSKVRRYMMKNTGLRLDKDVLEYYDKSIYLPPNISRK